MASKTIALMTDFGLSDIYVGVMKGVIRGICADADLIDITHAIPPQDVVSGALALKNSFSYFPKGTTFLTIVDPDVGSDRMPIAVKAGDYFFVAPDNGVLTHVLDTLKVYEIVSIENRQYMLPKISATFHGRDIFSPIAAHIANGVPLSSFGRSVQQLQRFELPTLDVTKGLIKGGIAHIDHFGNIITNIGVLAWVDSNTIILEGGSPIIISAKNVSVKIGKQTIASIHRAYYEVPEGNLLAQIDSTGALEIAIYKGNAAKHLDVKMGDVVEITWEI
jgi:S-adenosyl-L-methionine hydrolase (adenosine-forming)